MISMNIKSIVWVVGIIIGLYFACLLPILPIPLDTIQGLYHPFRDIQTEYSRGIHVNNPLITDPIRQQFPWKFLAIKQMKSGEFPLWNPLSFSGTPLLANIQSAPFYPGNITFLIPFPGDEFLSFARQWSLYIYLQTVLSFYFFYLYVKKIGSAQTPAILTSIAWALCGYNLAWWQWGNIGHTILWFPLILWSIEKIIEATSHQWFILSKYHLLLIISIASSFLAGHWQSFFLVAINTFFYLLYRIPVTIKYKKGQALEVTSRRLKQWIQLFIVGILTLLIVSIQLLPSLEFINKSARAIDPTQWQRIDWFYPYEHLIQFIAPDFFGNPSTYNYWGVWNYGEYSSYVGLITLIAALAIVFKYTAQKISNIINKNKPYLNSLDINESNIGIGFFLFCLVINLLLITRNPFTELPYQQNLPLFSSTQPSRGIVMVDFSLCILAAVSLTHWLKSGKTMNRYILTSWMTITISLIILLLITATQNMSIFTTINSQPTLNNSSIAQRNLIVPLTIALVTPIILLISRIPKIGVFLFASSIVLINSSDMLRYFTKFNSWSDTAYLYPQTPQTDQNNSHIQRYMTTDSRLIAPNINIPYGISSIEGYDPLYFNHYGKFIGLWSRNAPDLSPFPANRILTPHNINKNMIKISGTTHIFSLTEMPEICDLNLDSCLSKFGQTYLYNTNPQSQSITLKNAIRIFSDEQSLANYIFSEQFNPEQEALILSSRLRDNNNQYINLGAGNNNLLINNQTDNSLIIQAEIEKDNSFLYIPNTYDEGWHATINGRDAKIERTNFSFQGIQLPQGSHTIEIKYLPQSFVIGALLSISGLAISITIFSLSKWKANI